MLRQWLIKDWRTHKYAGFALLLIVLSSLVIVLYYVNYPRPELNADTPAYLDVVQHIQAHLGLVNTWRLPGYPLFITLVYVFAGQNNLMAVSIVQAMLFVLATLEIYVLALLLFQRGWLAFLVGLLVGTNLVLLSYVKPIMSEGLALWQLTTVALVTVYFMRVQRASVLWLLTLCLLPLLFTRPEWVYLPVLLFAYLFFIALQRGSRRRLLLHVVLALILIYGLLGGYIGLNTLLNHYPGLSAIENYNLLGKVLQYKMQDEVPSYYAQISHQLDYYVAHVDNDPYHVLRYMPTLAAHNALPAGSFARSILLHHPVEFLLKSVPFLFSSLVDYYDATRIPLAGPFDTPLNWFKALYRGLYVCNGAFPLCVLVWSVLLCWRRTRSQPVVMAMGAILLLALYALIVTTLGGYRPDDYMRVHIVFDPLLLLVIWGSLLMGIVHTVRQGWKITHKNRIAV